MKMSQLCTAPEGVFMMATTDFQRPQSNFQITRLVQTTFCCKDKINFKHTLRTNGDEWLVDCNYASIMTKSLDSLGVQKEITDGISIGSSGLSIPSRAKHLIYCI